MGRAEKALIALPRERAADETKEEQFEGADSDRHQEIGDGHLKRNDGGAGQVSQEDPRNLDNDVENEDSGNLSGQCHDPNSRFVPVTGGLGQFGRANEIDDDHDDHESARKSRRYERLP